MEKPQIYYPAVNGGKYHRANPISETALCGSPVLLAVHPLGAIHVQPGAQRHPICCGNCAKAN